MPIFQIKGQLMIVNKISAKPIFIENQVNKFHENALLK